MVRTIGWMGAVGFSAALLACNVESTSDDTGGVGGSAGDGAGGTSSGGRGGAPGSGGTSSGGMGQGGAEPGSGGMAGSAGAGPEPEPVCPVGVTVVLSDWLSTQVALSDLEGNTLSPSFISTASTQSDGLAFALSGDVALPTHAQASGRVVLLDRYGTNVISWVDPRSGDVLHQLPVGTGFESNPQDYLEIPGNQALVTRYGENMEPGTEPHDQGGDVLFLDLDTYRITGSLALPRVRDLPPRPTSMTRVGDHVIVNLERISADFTTKGNAMLAAIDLETKELAWSDELPGLKMCGRLVPSPSGQYLYAACTGAVDYFGNYEDLSQSAIVVFDPKTQPLAEVRRYTAEDLVGEPLQSAIAFANDHTLLFKTQTGLGGDRNNRWLALDLRSGAVETLLEARPDSEGNGKGIVFGAMLCAPGCSDVCLMADADRGVLQRARVQEDGSVVLIDPVVVEDMVGLPPRDLSYR